MSLQMDSKEIRNLLQKFENCKEILEEAKTSHAELSGKISILEKQLADMGAATIEEADILIKKLQKSIAADTAALTEGVNKMYTALSEYQNDAE